MRRLYKIKKKSIKLEDVNPGTLFVFDNQLHFKTAFESDEGAVEAYTAETGMFFWGNVDTVIEQRNLMVNVLTFYEIPD